MKKLEEFKQILGNEFDFQTENVDRTFLINSKFLSYKGMLYKLQEKKLTLHSNKHKKLFWSKTLHYALMPTKDFQDHMLNGF